ncbi:hypothetical protein MTTB_07360 [Methanothermobacter tenebrarum]|jgi:hypothetical protein|uniref:Uncharacterized protein n=1 Tax=Methanothermobacter tenebrarum TaxID=680118 RepID=A0ABN6PAV7_9EURY|nr:hypothetical protein MTTB_07360 [Methanothermobacter tenebrarum]
MWYAILQFEDEALKILSKTEKVVEIDFGIEHLLTGKAK